MDPPAVVLFATEFEADEQRNFHGQLLIFHRWVSHNCPAEEGPILEDAVFVNRIGLVPAIALDAETETELCLLIFFLGLFGLFGLLGGPTGFPLLRFSDFVILRPHLFFCDLRIDLLFDVVPVDGVDEFQTRVVCVPDCTCFLTRGTPFSFLSLLPLSLFPFFSLSLPILWPPQS